MKSIGIIQSEIKRGLVYKLDTFLNMLYPVVRFMVQYSLWMSIYYLNKNSQSIFGFTKSAMISYFLVSYTVTVIIKSDTISLGSEIKNGSVDRDLIKPINYMFYRLSKNLGSRVIPLLCILPFLVIAFLAIGKDVSLSINPWVYVLFIIFLAIGFIINFFIDFLIGMSALVFDEVWAINASINHIKRFISGEYIPISILPLFLFNILSFSPFQYVIYYPAIILTKTPVLSEAIQTLLLGCLWVILLYIISKVFWNYMIKKYSAFGG